MSTPQALLAALAGESAFSGLAQAVSRLSERYRVGIDEVTRGIVHDIDRAAYIAARMPATAAAVASALQQAQLHHISSVLDLGSGPGSALWSVIYACPTITTLTAFERDPGLITIGQRLAQVGPAPLQQATWIAGDVNKLPALPPHDVVMASYLTNELNEQQRIDLIHAAWDLCTVGILIIEPGTPRGFAAINAIRSQLIARGANIAAPCGHQKACPIANGSDANRWCHFRVRVQRSRLHRQAKGATVGFEDEPFSFIYATRQPTNKQDYARIISTPHVHKGAATLSLCTADGIHDTVIPRRERERYKRAAKHQWGDQWNESITP